MKEKIEEILRIIKQGDVDAFDAALHKYNIDINYNFFNDIGEMRHDEIVVVTMERLLDIAGNGGGEQKSHSHKGS